MKATKPGKNTHLGLKAVSQPYCCFIEDTYDGCYRDVTSALVEKRGWKQNLNYKKPNSLKKRLPGTNKTNHPDFLWTISEKSINFELLKENQIVNHFDGISRLTTKSGFCEILHDLQWICCDKDDISPRCYNLGDARHRDMFIDDYRISSLITILQWIAGEALFRHKQRISEERQLLREESKLELFKPLESLLSQFKSFSSKNIRGPFESDRDIANAGIDKHYPEYVPLIALPIPGEDLKGKPYESVTESELHHNTRLVDLVIQGISRYMKVHGDRTVGGAYPDVDGMEFKAFDMECVNDEIYGIPATDWDALYKMAYRIIECTDIAKSRCGSITYYNNIRRLIAFEVVNPLKCIQFYGSVNCGTIDALDIARNVKRLLLLQNYYTHVNKQYVAMNCESINVREASTNIDRAQDQSGVQGMKNIWVVKAPEAARGVNFRLFYKLEDIMECERKMPGRTVQKYLECPLLAPRSRGSSFATHTSSDRTMTMTKFDLRIWVLVTSFEPLTAYIYTRVYGKRCGSSVGYTTNTQQLHDLGIHLTNYSVQKKMHASATVHSNSNKLQCSESSSSKSSKPSSADVDDVGKSDILKSVVEVDDLIGVDNQSIASAQSNDSDESVSNKTHSSTTNKLRDICVSNRKSSVSTLKNEVQMARLEKAVKSDGVTNNASANDTDRLLITHEELLNSILPHYLHTTIVSSDIPEHYSPELIQDAHNMWKSDIWVEIKRKVFCTLEANREHVQQSSCGNEFELLGYDVILKPERPVKTEKGTRCKVVPWILEVNMSPGIAHRNEQQNSIINHMMEGLVRIVVDKNIGTTDVTGTDLDYSLGRWEALVSRKNICCIKASATGSNMISLLSGNVKHEKLLATLPSQFQALVLAQPTAKAQTAVLDSYINTMMATSNKPQNPSETGVGSSVVLQVQGVGVSTGYVQFVDAIVCGHEAVLLLQRWSRRYLERNRFYHRARLDASLMLQCFYRCYAARIEKQRLKQIDAAISIQTVYRQVLASRRVVCILRNKYAVVIQTRVRFWLLQRKKILFRVSMCGKVINRWICQVFQMYKQRFACRIQRCLRSWWKYRKQCKRIIFHLIALNYRHKLRVVKLIQRQIRCFLVRRKLLNVMRRNKLKQVAHEIVEVHLVVLKQKWKLIAEAARVAEEMHRETDLSLNTPSISVDSSESENGVCVVDKTDDPCECSIEVFKEFPASIEVTRTSSPCEASSEDVLTAEETVFRKLVDVFEKDSETLDLPALMVKSESVENGCENTAIVDSSGSDSDEIINMNIRRRNRSVLDEVVSGDVGMVKECNMSSDINTKFVLGELEMKKRMLTSQREVSNRLSAPKRNLSGHRAIQVVELTGPSHRVVQKPGEVSNPCDFVKQAIPQPPLPVSCAFNSDVCTSSSSYEKSTRDSGSVTPGKVEDEMKVQIGNNAPIMIEQVSPPRIPIAEKPHSDIRINQYYIDKMKYIHKYDCNETRVFQESYLKKKCLGDLEDQYRSIFRDKEFEQGGVQASKMQSVRNVSDESVFSDEKQEQKFKFKSKANSCKKKKSRSTKKWRNTNGVYTKKNAQSQIHEFHQKPHSFHDVGDDLFDFDSYYSRHRSRYLNQEDHSHQQDCEVPPRNNSYDWNSSSTNKNISKPPDSKKKRSLAYNFDLYL